MVFDNIKSYQIICNILCPLPARNVYVFGYRWAQTGDVEITFNT